MSLKVSIIIATFNRAHLIEDTLQSIQNQTYNDFECLIIDDGSTDDTIKKIKSFLDDTRFKYHSRPQRYTKGLPGCRNFGIDNAKGSYLLFVDDDDWIHSDLFKLSTKYLENKELDFIHYQKIPFTEPHPIIKELTGEPISFPISKNNINQVVKNEIALASCTVMWKTDTIGLDRFQEDLQYAEEWEFYTRLLLKGARGYVIDTVLYYARKHPESNTGEFYAGNKKRMKSMIEASKLVISNLNDKNLLSPDLIHFFCWESVRLKSRSLYQHLLSQSSLSSRDRLKIQLTYYSGPFKKSLIRLKKRLK